MACGVRTCVSMPTDPFVGLSRVSGAPRLPHTCLAGNSQDACASHLTASRDLSQAIDRHASLNVARRRTCLMNYLTASGQSDFKSRSRTGHRRPRRTARPKRASCDAPLAGPPPTPLKARLQASVKLLSVTATTCPVEPTRPCDSNTLLLHHIRAASNRFINR